MPGFIPGLLAGQGIPINPSPAGKTQGKGHRSNNPDSPGPEHGRGQLRAEPVTARQPQILGDCLLINLLIMFCFNPRAWRRCGNVRHLFMPRVAGGVTKASVPQVPPRVTWPSVASVAVISRRPGAVPVPQFPPQELGIPGSTPPPALSVPAVTSTVTSAVTRAGPVAVLSAVALCRAQSWP